MWTSQIEASDKADGRVQTLVSYSSDVDGEKPFNRVSFATSLDQLKREVQSEIDRVSAAFAFADSLQKQFGKPFDTTVVVTPPEPAEAARQKYFKDLAVLNKMREAIAAGIRKETDQDYLDQLALVKSEFRPEYESGANLVAAVELRK